MVEALTTARCAAMYRQAVNSMRKSLTRIGGSTPSWPGLLRGSLPDGRLAGGLAGWPPASSIGLRNWPGWLAVLRPRPRACPRPGPCRRGSRPRVRCRQSSPRFDDVEVVLDATSTVLPWSTSRPSTSSSLRMSSKVQAGCRRPARARRPCRRRPLLELVEDSLTRCAFLRPRGCGRAGRAGCNPEPASTRRLHVPRDGGTGREEVDGLLIGMSRTSAMVWPV